MIEYVCGFMFNQYLDQVSLIVKNKPEWQKGLLNGIGGKIERGESAEQAMIREFKEETGVLIEQWRPLLILQNDEWRVFFLFGKCSQSQFNEIETTEDEEIVKVSVDYLSSMATVDNLQWLIPMAQYFLLNDSYQFRI
jgi:8-oxo-dGTP diphosphatase